MQIDLLASPDYILGDITHDKNLTEALGDISARFLNSDAGVRVAFFTNSNNVSFCHTINNQCVLPHVGRTLTNGICYAVSKEPNGFLTKADCLYKNGEEEVIFSQTERATYFYELFLPSFNKVQSLSLIIDDDATITASAHLSKAPIVFLGGNLTLGYGSTFASAMFSQIISRNTKRDFYNLALPDANFLNAKLAAEVKRFNPAIIVSEIDCANMSFMYLRGNLGSYIKELIKTTSAPIIAFSSAFCGYKTKSYVRKIKFINKAIKKLSSAYPGRIAFVNVEDVFSKFDCDEYSFSKDYINDNGNLILADYLTSIISEYCG